MPKPLGTYALINSTTLGSNQSSITFSSIPATFTDLVLVFEGTATGSNVKTIKFNGDTSALYSCTTLYGTGSSGACGRYSESYVDVVNSGTNRQITIINIFDYTNTVTNKTYMSRHSCSASSTELIFGLWRSTSAINSITINTGTANSFVTGTTLKLYGITAGNQ